MADGSSHSLSLAQILEAIEQKRIDDDKIKRGALARGGKGLFQGREYIRFKPTNGQKRGIKLTRFPTFRAWTYAEAKANPKCKDPINLEARSISHWFYHMDDRFDRFNPCLANDFDVRVQRVPPSRESKITIQYVEPWPEFVTSVSENLVFALATLGDEDDGHSHKRHKQGIREVNKSYCGPADQYIFLQSDVRYTAIKDRAEGTLSRWCLIFVLC